MARHKGGGSSGGGAGGTAGGTGGGVRRRLGRGLESLITAPVRIEVDREGRATPGALAPSHPVEEDRATAPGSDLTAVRMIPIDEIRANPTQPRQRFDESALAGLAQSIRAEGVIQPIVVRPLAERDGRARYEIVAGERRWRAARMLDLPLLPAVVRDLDDRTAARLSLVENLQREDLNPMERAEAFRRLGDEFAMTQQEIADHVGLDRTSITNHLRLLELDAFTQDALRSGGLGMGHGRALLAIANIESRRHLTRQALEQGWSVRELERRVRTVARAIRTRPASAASARHAHLRDLEERLAEHLGTKVAIRSRRKGAGTLSIEFYSLDQFEGVLRRLGFRYE